MNKYKKGFKRYTNWMERNKGIKIPTNYELEYYNIFVEVYEI